MKKIMIISLSKEKEPIIKGTPHKLEKFLNEEGYRTYFMTSPKKIDIFSLVGYFFKFYIKYLFFRPEAVITFHPISIIPLTYKKLGLLRKPVIYYWWDFYTEGMGEKWPIGLLAYAEFSSLKSADMVFTNSIFQRETARKMGIDAKYFGLGVEDYFRRDVKKINLPGKNQFKILYCGDMTSYKNVDKLVSAMKELDCDLILIGPINEEIKGISTENVYFLGPINHKEIPRYIQSADLIAVTADQDGTLKMYEALRMGKPILAMSGRIAYVLRHMENAYLTSDFREGINFLMKNPKLLKKMTENNTKFHVEKINKRFEEQIREIKKYINRGEGA